MIKIKSVYALLNQKDIEAFAHRLDLVHPKYKLLWEIGISTGLRISDLLKLKKKDIKNGILCITETKTRKKHSIALETQILNKIDIHVNRYGLRRSDFLFFPKNETRAGRPMHRNSVYEVIKKAATSLGLDGVGTHTMRKTHAGIKYRETKSLESVQKSLNHKFQSTTLSYLVSNKDVMKLLGI